MQELNRSDKYEGELFFRANLKPCAQLRIPTSTRRTFGTEPTRPERNGGSDKIWIPDRTESERGISQEEDRQ